MDKKELIGYLFKEKEIARQEAFVNIKAVNQVSLILLPFFFTSVGVILGFDSLKKIIDGFSSILLLNLIGQLIFLLWMYGLSVVSNLASLSGYMAGLEEKINYLSKQQITEWETVIHKKLILRWNSGQAISTFFWNFFYLVLFGWIGCDAYIKGQNLLILALYIVETSIIILIFILIKRTRDKSYNLITPGIKTLKDSFELDSSFDITVVFDERPRST